MSSVLSTFHGVFVDMKTLPGFYLVTRVTFISLKPGLLYCTCFHHPFHGQTSKLIVDNRFSVALSYPVAMKEVSNLISSQSLAFKDSLNLL